MYVVLATLWILTSDLAAERLGLHATASMLKGTIFVLTTGVLLYSVLFRAQTSLTRFQKATRESEERFSYVVENALEGILIVGGGQLRYLNAAALSCFGGGEQERLLGSPILGRVHEAHREQLQATMAHLDENPGAVPRAQLQFLRIDGTAFDAEFYCVPFLYGEERGAIIFFRDVTDRVNAEAERQKLEAQFHQAQKLESVGRLAGGIAHDFNNYLTVINGYADLVASQMGPSDPIRKRILDIREAGMRAASLTSQLLAFSRKDVVNLKPVDINQIVRGADRMLRRLLGEDIVVVLDLAPEVGLVIADEARLNQVIMNLAVNARDAMPSGGTIQIRTSPVEVQGTDNGQPPIARTGPAVNLSFSDTGTGIEPAVLEHIFEPFFTTKKEGHGTGLGLSTVYGIVNSLKGWISVSSQVGSGTTFEIFLPRCEAGVLSAVDAHNEGQALRGTETILLAEDFEQLRQFAAVTLEQLGYTVLIAANATEALEIIRNYGGRIDALVTDVVMPGTTGRELATIAKSVRPYMKILFVSGYTADIGAQNGLVDGMPLLSKPFTREGLAKSVRGVLTQPATPA